MTTTYKTYILWQKINLSCYIYQPKEMQTQIHALTHERSERPPHTQVLLNIACAIIIPTLISDSRAPSPPPYRLCTQAHQNINLGTLGRGKEFGFASVNVYSVVGFRPT